MRRALVALFVVLVMASASGGDTLRMEIGINGAFAVGGWTTCRIDGIALDDGATVVVHAGDTFSRELAVTGGVARGVILMSEASSRPVLEIPEMAPDALKPEMMGPLRPIEGVLPAVFIGGNTPAVSEVQAALGGREVAPIAMTADDFAARDRAALEWVPVFVLGDLDANDLARVRTHLAHLARLGGAVVVARDANVRGWLTSLPFRRSVNLRVYRIEVVPFLPVPGRLVRPDVVEMFGPAEWPRSASQDVALGFVFVLVFAAVAMVLPDHARWVRWGRYVLIAVVCFAVTWLVRVQASPVTETVALVECFERAPDGVLTTVSSRAILTGGSVEEMTVSETTAQAVPVAWSAVQWVNHPLRVNAAGRLDRSPAVRSREVFMRVEVVDQLPEPTESTVLLDGATVYAIDPEFPDNPASTGEPFLAWVEKRQVEDDRVEALRDGMMRWWFTTRRAAGVHRLGWTAPRSDNSAGTFVVERVSRGRDDQRNP